MSDSIARYQTCPVVVFLGDVAVPGEFPNGKLFGLEQIAECATHVHEALASARSDIDKVFNEFDKDNSGGIDKAELKMVCAELGVEMGNADVNNMMDDLDLDRNGIIDRAEF